MSVDGPAPLVLVACSVDKLDRRAPAGQLYTGSLFALALRAAKALTDDAMIRVLSARHGFLALDTELDPYNTTWSDPERITIPELWRQAAALPTFAEVISLMPTAYTKVARVALEGPVMAPLRHAGGIGWMRHRLALIADTGAIPGAYRHQAPEVKP